MYKVLVTETSKRTGIIHQYYKDIPDIFSEMLEVKALLFNYASIRFGELTGMWRTGFSGENKYISYTFELIDYNKPFIKQSI